MKKLPLLLISAFTFASCATGGKNNFFDAFQGTSEYESQFRENTKKRTAQSSFENTASAEVTIWNDKLREKYIAEMKESFRLPPGEVDVLRMEQYSEGEKYFVFIVSITTRNPEDMDLSSSDGLWRLSLGSADESRRISPDSVDMLEYRNSRNQFFYLNMTRFNETYKVRFDRSHFLGASKVTLYLDGPLGSLEFPYSIEGPRTEAQRGE